MRRAFFLWTTPLNLSIGLAASLTLIAPSQAQNFPPTILPEERDFPEIQPLPPIRDLLPISPPEDAPSQASPTIPQDSNESIIVQEFIVRGSTVFSTEELAAITDPFRDRPLQFSDLLDIRTAITKLYVENGYITSGAFLPPDQVVDDGSVEFQVIEGQLDDIQIQGATRLQEGYIRRRVRLGAKTPLNVDELLKQLQTLQLNPLISGLSAELATSPKPGFNLLIVSVSEADSGNVFIRLDNSSTKSTGRFQRQIIAEERNFSGRGDRFSLAYSNTDGSNTVDVSYEIPINARDGSLNLRFNQSWTQVITEPFDQLDLEGESRNYSLRYHQPILKSPRQELALGIQMGRRESETELLDMPFPVSPGADAQGQTKITGLNLFQEWTKRNRSEVLALRSDFGLGLDIGATNNAVGPDGNFFLWRGQAQWVKQFNPDQLLVLRSNLQLADRALLPLEQFGLGGSDNGRGYPQDVLLVDNGITATTEARFPIFRTGDRKGLLQIIPFVDYGFGWNLENRPIEGSNHLLSTGVGLQWQWTDRISLEFSWGVPLIPTADRAAGLEESQVFFSLDSRLF